MVVIVISEFKYITRLTCTMDTVSRGPIFLKGLTFEADVKL